MELRAAAVVSLFLSLVCETALAQERVTVGTVRQVANGALFLADANGYFTAEGLTVEMSAFPSAQPVVDALAGGRTDFGLADFTPMAFNMAGQGRIKLVAAQAREKRDVAGYQIVASNAAYDRGLRKPEDVANRAVAIGQIGSTSHYQLGQIARIRQFNLASLRLKSEPTVEGMARAVASGEVDAAILPPIYVREMLISGQGRLIGWYSELDEQQLGALFVSSAVLKARRAVVEKFVRAYRRGAADYTAALLRRDRFGKRISDAKSQAAAMTIARYVYAGHSTNSVAGTVEASVFYVEPSGRLDLADLERQIAWFQSQGLVEAGVDARAIVDPDLNR